VILTAATPKQFPESVLALGDDRNLIAIATAPEKARSSKPTVIMLNAGVLHRVGPHRLHVVLARALTSLGFASCRVDLSGIGDSRVITGHGSFRESAVADTRIVMEHLAAANGTNGFVIFGLCSGADNALAAAAIDPRIKGLILVDPPAYTTFQSHVRKFRQRAARSTPLVLCTAFFAAALRSVLRRLRPRDGIVAGRQSPLVEEYRRQLNALLARGTHILCIYSGSLHERFNHADQLFELFPELRGRIMVEYFGDADHVFTELTMQQRLIDVVVAWLAQTYR
jgi:pimeloyl-ACP methyl ester carboxylesterase